MSMRVITGSARGVRLRCLPGEDVRPTAARVKEAVFSAVQFELEGRRALDLFGGSGQLAIEALSRGAKSAVIVEQNREAVEIIKKNLSSARLSERARVENADFRRFLKTTGERFDIAFIDPPYRAGLYSEAIALTEPLLSQGGIIICEHPADMILPERAGRFSISKRSRYGKTAVTFYREGEENE